MFFVLEFIIFFFFVYVPIEMRERRRCYKHEMNSASTKIYIVRRRLTVRPLTPVKDLKEVQKVMY